MLTRLRTFVLLMSILLMPVASFAQTYLPGIQEIINKGKLVVSIHAYDSPPMFNKDPQGELVGYDIALAHYLGQNLGVPVEFVRTAKTFDEVVDVVNAGKADIAVSLLTPNLTRARKVYFTQPYIYLKKLLAYNRLAAAQYKLSDPANQISQMELKIGVLKGSSYINYAKRYYPSATLVLFPTVGEALSAVESGEIFAFFGNSANVPYTLEQDKDMNLYVEISTLNSQIDPIAIAVSGKYPALVSWIDLALKLRPDEISKKAFEEKYTHTGVQ